MFSPIILLYGFFSNHFSCKNFRLENVGLFGIFIFKKGLKKKERWIR